MGKFVRFLLVAIILSATGLAALDVSAQGVTQSVSDVLSTVTGSVWLKSANKKISGDLKTVFEGRDSELPTSKKGRKISVSGTNVGGNSVQVIETGVASGEAKYSFTFPVLSVINKFAKKARSKSKSGSVITNINGDVIVKAQSVDSIASTVNASTKMSIQKLIAKRVAGKASLTGTFFTKGTSAKGRFKLIFQ